MRKASVDGVYNCITLYPVNQWKAGLKSWLQLNKYAFSELNYSSGYHLQITHGQINAKESQILLVDLFH